jgi:hypothetical protein
VVRLARGAPLPCLGGLGNLWKAQRDGDRRLQLFVLNEEFLVSAGHQPALITSLPFVHTARRYYRLDVLVSFVEPVWVSSPGGSSDANLII